MRKFAIIASISCLAGGLALAQDTPKDETQKAGKSIKKAGKKVKKAG